MNPDTVQTIQTVLVMLISIVTTCSLPWVIKIERRLSRIEAIMGNGGGRCTEAEKRIRSLELALANQDQ